MRQIFCKLPNPFPYLNYITKFFFGRKSYRQRVFQGPLTLGLQSPSLRASSFRLACGNPSIPARSQLTALNRAPVTFASFCPRRLQPTFPFRGCSRRFSCSGTRAQSTYRAKPHTCYLCILLSASVTTDLCYPLTPAVKIRYTFPMKRIYIGNLSFNTTEESLNNAFSAFGEVISATLIMDKITNRSKGFGFVEMPDDDAAFNAIRSLNGKDLDGRKVRVSIAEDKGPRNPRSNR